MSYLPYPPDRYHGGSGEASATVRLGSQEPELDADGLRDFAEPGHHPTLSCSMGNIS